MYFVAVTDRRAVSDAALAPLALALETTLYELRMLLSGGLPAIVLITADSAIAEERARQLRSFGLAAVTCAGEDACRSSNMLQLRDFALEPDALVEKGEGARLPYEDIAFILKATHRHSEQVTTESKERKLRPFMAIATGGLILSKTTTRTTTSSREEREQVIYLFRHSGQRPWLLGERSTRYGGLGKDLKPSSGDNFAFLTQRLRQRAPGASFDERLQSLRPIRVISDVVHAVDILAHLIVLGATDRSR